MADKEIRLVAALEFQAVRKLYGNHFAVNGISFRIESGELFALVGSSGCGKTTLLRLINGLEQPSEGVIWVDGRKQTEYDVISLRRRMGYVIQESGLLPHLNVLDNVSLLGRLRGHEKRRRELRCGELLEMVQLPYQTYAERFPHELSGGQRQRVGVARALYLDPPFLLMDEPFGALDPVTRHGLQQAFLAIKSNLKKTIVLVTHDIREAMLLADRIGVMVEGRMVQIDSPHHLRTDPVDLRVRELLATGGWF